jgi:hypothetical protein
VTAHLDAALQLAAQGRRVFPIRAAPGGVCSCGRGCGAAGRHPHLARWPERASTDPAEITAWWSRWPIAWLAIATGAASDLVVVDVESVAKGGVDGFAALADLQRQHGRLPPTLTASTPTGGMHLYFRHPGGRVKNTAGELGRGLDVRGDDGMVMAPPSPERHWTVTISPAPMPGWLAALVVSAEPDQAAKVSAEPDQGGRAADPEADPAPPGSATAYGETALADELARLAEATVGERNDALNRAGFRLGQLITAGEVAADLATRELHAAGIALGLPEGEVAATVRSGLDGGVRKPRSTTTDTSEGAATVTDPPDQGAHLAAVPDYPLDAIGGPIADLVKATPMLPAALVGGAALGALAHLAAPARLALVDGWTEAPILWVPLLGPAGSGKSPALRRAWGPLWDYGLLADRLLDDLTIEKLARMLEDTAGMAAIVTDELATTLGSLGRYHRSGPSSDRGRLLALWSGGPWRYSRVTAKVDLLIEAPVVVVTGPLVSEQHRLLGPAGDGMRPRWLPHLVAQGDDGGDLDTRPAGGGGWSDLVKDLAAVQRPRVWHLDGTARGDWLAARKRWKALARADEPDTVRLAAAKADTHAARVALALAEGHDPGSGGPVPPEAVTGALAVLDYVIDCWRALGEGEVLALSRRDEELDAAVDRMAAWIERRPSKAANRRELGRSKVGGARTTKELDAVIERYAERFPGTVEHNVIPEGGGTPQTVVHAPSRG